MDSSLFIQEIIFCPKGGSDNSIDRKKNEGTRLFLSIGAKYFKYAFKLTNLSNFTRSFHGFLYVEPLRKSLNHLFCCLEQGG